MARERIFSQIIGRKPVVFEPYSHMPKYHYTYWEETLACGHTHTSFRVSRQQAPGVQEVRGSGTAQGSLISGDLLPLLPLKNSSDAPTALLTRRFGTRLRGFLILHYKLGPWSPWPCSHATAVRVSRKARTLLPLTK